MTPLRFRPEVAQDVAAAHDWYAERSDTAAPRFMVRLESAFERIDRAPQEFPVVHRDVRRALLARFPYAIFFVIEPSAIVVLAVLHQAVHPGVWRERITPTGD